MTHAMEPKIDISGEPKEITHEDIIRHIKECLICRTVIWQYILKEKLTLND